MTRSTSVYRLKLYLNGLNDHLGEERPCQYTCGTVVVINFYNYYKLSNIDFQFLFYIIVNSFACSYFLKKVA